MAKIATSIKQSQALLEIGIDRSTADMYWWYAEGKNYLYVGKPTDDNAVPAWSLNTLVELLPMEHDGNTINIAEEDGYWCIRYGLHLYGEELYLIDAVVETFIEIQI